MDELKERKKIKSEVKHLNSAIKKLENEGYDVWANNVHYQGYGFKVILEKSWIDVYVSMNYGGEDSIIITKLEKKSNVLDKFCAKRLAEKESKNFEELYDLVKELIGNER